MQTMKKEVFGLKFGFALASVLLLTGTLNNYSALEPILISIGVFHNACDNVIPTFGNSTTDIEESTSTCERQLYLLNMLFFVFTGGIDIAGVVLGIYFDKVSRRTSTLTSCLLYQAFVAFAFLAPPNVLPHSTQVWILPILLVIGGIAGSLHNLIGLSHIFDVEKAFPKGNAFFTPLMVNALVTACWGVSGFSVWILNKVYTKTFAPLSVLIGVHFGMAIPIMLFYALFVDSTDFTLKGFLGRTKSKPHSGNRSDPESQLKEQRLSELGNLLKKEVHSFKERSNHPHPRLLVFALGCVLTTSYVHMCFYSSTQPEQFRWINEEATSSLTSAAAILQPALCCAVVLILAPLVSRPFITPRILWVGGATLLVAWTTMACIRVAKLQYVTICIFAIYRAAFYVLYYETARIYLPPDWFGRCTATAYTLAGSLTVLSGLFLNKWVISAQAYLEVNIILGGLATLSTVFLAILSCTPQKHHPLLGYQEKTTVQN